MVVMYVERRGKASRISVRGLAVKQSMKENKVLPYIDFKRVRRPMPEHLNAVVRPVTTRLLQNPEAQKPVAPQECLANAPVPYI